MKAETLLSQLRAAERAQAPSDESLTRGWQRLREAAFAPAVAGPAVAGGKASIGHATGSAGHGAAAAGKAVATQGASAQSVAVASKVAATQGGSGHAAAATLTAGGAKGLAAAAPTAVSAGGAGWTVIGAKAFAAWVALGGSVGLGAVGTAHWVETRSAAIDSQEMGAHASEASGARPTVTHRGRGATVPSPPAAEPQDDANRRRSIETTEGSDRGSPGSISVDLGGMRTAADVSGAGDRLKGEGPLTPPGARAAARPEVGGRPASGSADAAEPAGARDLFDAELQLIKRAKAELDQGHPSTARDMLDEHARSFPRGAFAEEREGLRAIALCRSGEVKRGRQAAERLTQSGSDSVLAARIRRACGGDPQ